MRGNTRSWLASLATFAFVLPFIAACGDDGTGPTTNLNPAEAEAALEQVIDQYFNDNPGLSSLETFGAAIGNALPSLAPASFTLHPESPSLFGMAGRLGQSMRAVYTRGTSLPMLMANIPTELLGTTFVYDPGTNQYVASERTGAPSDAVRFILYDGITTLNEVGWFDLTDKSTFGTSTATVDVTFRVFITAVSTTKPVVEYVVTGDVDDTGGDLFFTGFLSDGTGQLDFEFDITGTDAAGYTAAFSLSSGNVSVTLNLSETTTGNSELVASITAGSDKITFDIKIAANGDIQDGSGVFFNDGSGDVRVATFTGNIEDGVSVVNTEGNPLTQQELASLGRIFGALELAFVLMEELFAFGLALIGIAFFF